MLTEEKVWKEVTLLKGNTLYTYTELNENFITNVEDTGSDQDEVIIKDRDTRPIRRDIIAAYKLLYLQKKLEREKDLAWLAGPEKQTSSIVFRIVGEISKNDIYPIKPGTRKPILKLKI